MKKQTYIAFLRGVNVGGNTILPMSELKTICENLGFKQVLTYIQSGNVVFESPLTEDAIIEKIELELNKKMGKHISVVVRSLNELIFILNENPFKKAEPAKIGVMFFVHPLQESFISGVSTSTGEELKANKREIYIYYPQGMGHSRIKFPKQDQKGTIRNINTIQKIIDLCNR